MTYLTTPLTEDEKEFLIEVIKAISTIKKYRKKYNIPKKIITDLIFTEISFNKKPSDFRMKD